MDTLVLYDDNHVDKLLKQVNSAKPEIWHASSVGDEEKVISCIKNASNFKNDFYNDCTALM